jgi:glycosyltransferase involved in cell wall biosynthesis
MRTNLHVNRQETPAIQIRDLAPARVLGIELGQQLSAIAACDERGCCYQRALCLVRLHTQPLGVVEFQFDEQGVSAAHCAQQIWRRLQAQINEHLQFDDLPPATGLDPGGLHCSALPRCLNEREEFLAHAPFVSVIVPTHNRPETLLPCLHSLLALHYPHYEVIVVDNAPGTQTTAELVRAISSDAPHVRYLREDRPGVSWARNCGIRAATGNILAFTDDDVVVDPYWLVEIVRGFSRVDNAGNVACVTGYNLPLELETPAQFWYEAYGGAYWFQENGGTSWGFSRRIYDMKEHRAEIALYPYRAGMFGCGASMAFTAAFLRSVHGFDPALGGNGPSRCGQDIAMFFQVITRGYSLVYEPAAVIYHLHRREYQALRRQIYRYGVGITAYLTKSMLDAPHLLFDFTGRLLLACFQSLVPFLASLLTVGTSLHPSRALPGAAAALDGWLSNRSGSFVAGLAFKGSRSAKPGKMPAHYPRELVNIRRKGMLYGPLAYLQSRKMMKKLDKTFPDLGKEHAMRPVEKES